MGKGIPNQRQAGIRRYFAKFSQLMDHAVISVGLTITVT